MGGAFRKTLIFGAIAFGALSVFEAIPYLGWFGGLIGLGLWAYLASRLVQAGKPVLALTDNPSIPAMGWAALVGALTGLLNALVSLLVSAVQLSGAQGVDAGVSTGMGVIGGMVGVAVWPFVGAFVCGLFGLIWGGRARPATATTFVPSPPTVSPDGRFQWDGQTWNPIPAPPTEITVPTASTGVTVEPQSSSQP